MTPRKKAVINFANILVMMELSGHLKNEGIIDDSKKFFDGFIENDHEIKRLWAEVTNEMMVIRKDTAKRFKKEDNL